MELQLERQYRIASHQAGPRGEARPSAIMGLLEDAAGEHAAAWGLSVPQLLPRGLTWVLTRYHLRLLRAVHYGEELRVVTWPSARRGRQALRDFEVSDAHGRTVAVATTSWAILNLESRRALPVSDVLPADFVLARRALPDDFPSLPALSEPEHEVELPVMLRDLDMNLHVNHVVYLQWALEAVPLRLLRASLPADIEIAYLAEARLGERVRTAFAALAGKEGAPVLAHSITNAATGRELARLRTGWLAAGRS